MNRLLEILFKKGKTTMKMLPEGWKTSSYLRNFGQNPTYVHLRLTSCNRLSQNWPVCLTFYISIEGYPFFPLLVVKIQFFISIYTSTLYGRSVSTIAPSHLSICSVFGWFVFVRCTMYCTSTYDVEIRVDTPLSQYHRRRFANSCEDAFAFTSNWKRCRRGARVLVNTVF